MAKKKEKIEENQELNTEEKEKKEAIDLVNSLKKNLNSYFKKEVMISGEDIIKEMKYQYLPTPSLILNKALNGGFLKGKTVEISGSNNSGKTYLCYQTIANDMKNNPKAIWLWIDLEGDFNPDACFGLFGVDPDRLLVQPVSQDGAEATLDALIALITEAGDKLSGFVLNSISALAPKDEIANSLDKQNIAQLARIMSKFLRVINGKYKDSKLVAIFINQLRTNVGSYGGGQTTTGGLAMGYFASQRIQMRKVKTDASLDENEYMQVKVKIDKNRGAIGNPNASIMLYIKYGEGIDYVYELINLAKEQELIQVKGGGNFIYTSNSGEEIKVRGAKNLIQYFKDNEELRKELEAKVNLDSGVNKLSSEEIEEIQKQEEEMQTVIKQMDSNSFSFGE